MDYKETIDFLYVQLPMFSRDGASAFKKDLTNTLALCEALGNPQKKFKTIHVAGTNGKGSSSHMLAAIMQQAGYKTGLYTSPHLYDFRERIRINGQLCSEAFVVRFVEQIMPELERIKPSFFEITVAMAFSYFAEQNVDIAIIETGLGGRLDSTNVIIPVLSLITNIGYDHMQFLGNTLQEIAAEKAGIIKENGCVVIAEDLPETRPVFEKTASKLNARINFVSDLWSISIKEQPENNKAEKPLLTLSAHRVDQLAEDATYQLDLTGIYQQKNLGGVLEAVHQLRQQGWKIGEKHLQEALKSVKQMTGLIGRWDQVLAEPWIITDVGHNVDGIKMILSQLDSMQFVHLHIVTGFVKDKDIAAALNLLPKNAQYYFTNAQIARALQAEELQIMAAKIGLVGEAYGDVTKAIQAANKRYQKGDLILVCGSVFLVAEVKGALEQLQ